MSQGKKQFHRRNTFSTFRDLVEYSKEVVYFIVRLRDIDGKTYWQNLGTGFLAGPYRLMTCAHCISDNKHEDEPMAQHRDGDVYLFVQKDELGKFHRVAMVGKENENIFVYPDLDVAVLIMPDAFYEIDGELFRNPDKHLELSENTVSIGSDMGILGYPFASLSFDKQGEVDISDIYIRADRGVINTVRHHTDMSTYESTTAFNPGNSGGPIFDIKTGTVIGIVHGYNPMPMHWVEDGHEDEDGNKITTKFRLRTIYSLGIASQSLLDIAKQHNISHRQK